MNNIPDCFYNGAYELSFDDGCTQQQDFFQDALDCINGDTLHEYHTRMCNDISAMAILSQNDDKHLPIIQEIIDALEEKLHDPNMSKDYGITQPELERADAGPIPWTEHKDHPISEKMLQVRYYTRLAALESLRPAVFVDGGY